MKRYRIHIISTLSGAFLGYILVHPYTMFVYAWVHWHETGKGISLSVAEVFRTALVTFHPVMFPMSLPFVLFGALIGLLIGVLIDRRHRLFEAQLETERRTVALETLHELMVTLSHYLLNANAIIGGMVRRCLRMKPEAGVVDSLNAISMEARKIDTVINVLQKITTIKTAEYASGGHELLIDISRDIDDKLRKGNVPESGRENQ